MGCWDAVQLPPADNSVNGKIFTVVSVTELLVEYCLAVPEKLIKVRNITVVPTKSDSDVIFCSQWFSKTLHCTLH